MDRNELTLALTAAFFGAVLLGWFLHWVFGMLNRRSGPKSIKQTALLVERVQNAEEARLAAEARLQAVERDLNQRIALMQAELNTAHESLEAARDETEQIRAAYREAVTGSG
jgi:nitrogen fixation/metabolism regulation signal transduction histidine kinase